MIRIPGRIPITIYPIFWFLAAVIGFFASGSFVGSFMWVIIILVSVLVHELGHALTALVFKRNPQIELVALGGLTSYPGKNLKFWQQFLVTLNGPLFGVGLYFLSSLLLSLNIFTNPYIVNMLQIFKMINLFWAIINLLPVPPLDGGHLVRILLEAAFGLKGFRASFVIGMVVALGISLAGFILGYYLIGAIFFIFTFQCFDLFRKTKNMTSSDRNDDNAKEVQDGELALQSGNKEEAKKIFLDIRGKSSRGVLHVTATQYLAFLFFEEGKKKEAYDLLISIKDSLKFDSLCLLQQLAFEEENYRLVADLSAKCYQVQPTEEVALRNAKAFAFLKKARPAGGWLRTATQAFKESDVDKLLTDNIFDPVRNDPIFKSFLIHKK
jgi:stage IV sporulation protein FB